MPRPLLVLAGVALGVLALACSPKAEQPDAATPAGYAAVLQQAETQGLVRVIARVSGPAGPGETSALAMTRELGAKDSHWCSERAGLLVAEVTPDQLSEMAQSGRFTSFREDRLAFPSLEASAPLVGAPEAQALGATGAGQTVAVLDTGIAVAHPFFGSRVRAEACFSSRSQALGAEPLCPNGEEEQIGAGAAAPCSFGAACGHGTHVAGIAAGAAAERSGVAPQAEILAVQVFSRFQDRRGGPTPCRDSGQASPCLASFTSDQIRALDHILTNLAERPIAAVNMSLGGGRAEEACDDDLISPVIDDLFSAGVFTVIAAGNDGFTNAVSRPACVASAIAVGATTKDDLQAPFSNRSPLVDVWAPGVAIVSATPPAGFVALSGSSMAAPHVAGAIAALRSLRPEASAQQIETALLTQTRNTTAGPRLDVRAAARSLGELAPVAVAATDEERPALPPAQPAFPDLIAQLQALPPGQDIRLLARPSVAEAAGAPALAQATARLQDVAKAAGAESVSVVRPSTGLVAIECSPRQAIAIARSGAAGAIEIDRLATPQR